MHQRHQTIGVESYAMVGRHQAKSNVPIAKLYTYCLCCDIAKREKMWKDLPSHSIVHHKGTLCGWRDSYTFRGADSFRIHGTDHSQVLVAH